MFILYSFFIVLLAWIGYISALFGFFYGPLILVTGAIFLIFSIIFGKKLLHAPFDYSIYLILLIMTVLFSLSIEPTIFSGRDQGSISQAAIYLVQENKLEFSTPASLEFFQIYGQGKALNYPGFYYTPNGDLITQFPIAYIAWLAIFYSIFGLMGFAFANGLLFFLFLLSIYELARLFSKDKLSSFLVLGFILTSFSFSWFLKFTLTENMAMALLWLSIYNLAKFIKFPRDINFYLYILSAFLLVFVRIEGIAFLTMGLLILLFNKNSRSFLLSHWRKKIALPFMIFSIIFLFNFFQNIYFYTELTKDLIKPGTDPSGIVQSFSSSFPYALEIFALYGMIGFFILGLLGIIYFAKIKKFPLLIPFFVTLPSFIYLIDYNISSDHPWMLRRFVFSILPVLILYSALLLGYTHKHNLKKIIAYLIAGLLIFFNLPAFSKYLYFTENTSLLKQTKELSLTFSDNDLILVDQNASGNNWSMLPGPMHSVFSKDAVYFFNPEDLSKIDKDKFDKIYLVTPLSNLEFYEKNLHGILNLKKYYSIETAHLEKLNKNSPEARLPQRQLELIRGAIFEIK